MNKENLSDEKNIEFLNNNLFKELCKCGCKFLFSNRNSNSLKKLPIFFSKLPIFLIEYCSMVDYDGFIVLKVNEKKPNKKYDIKAYHILQYLGRDQDGRQNYNFICRSMSIFFDFKRQKYVGRYYSLSMFTNIYFYQTEIFNKDEIFYNKINTLIHNLYCDNLLMQSDNITIPTHEDLNNYRNKLYQYMYKDCFGSKITYYIHIFNVYIYPEIKRVILDTMLRIDRWNILGFYCMLKK